MRVAQICPLRFTEVGHLIQVLQLMRAELGFRQHQPEPKTRDVHSIASSQ